MNDPLAIAESLASDFAASAVQRDKTGGTPKRERDALRASGLLGLIVPARLGGAGADWRTTFEAVRAIARADGSLAHVFGFQHLLVATVRLFGTAEQFEPLARQTVEKRLFWGNALNPLDDRTTLEKRGGDYVLRGRKGFSSGARDADVLVLSALDAVTKKLVIAVVPGDRAGITALDDWDNMGQRQTDSGTVILDDVKIAQGELLTSPGPLGSTFASLRPLIAQLSLVNVYVGIAEGAMQAALPLTRGRGKAWFSSGVEKIEDDPFVLAAFGDLHCELEAARHLAGAAAVKLDAAWTAGDALTPEGRGEVAIAVATAKVV
ncbi:MAG TPA: acyl-CoA dehydrogenase family protein, partial [Polyangiaceae bacterium]|nr:acyl-CoA dehydrogenase family protein [Polyangiaceae bacterium]